MLNSSRRAVVGLGVILAAAAVAAAPAPARARHADRVSGTYGVLDPGTTTCAPEAKHPSRLRCETSAFLSHYDGDLVGDSTVDFTWRIDCDRSSSEGEGSETFTGSLDGGPVGTLTWRIRFHAAFDCTGFFPFDFDGHGAIREGTGGFAHAHGSLRFGDTTYEGTLH